LLLFLLAGLLHDAYVQDEVDKDKEMHAHLYSSNWWVSLVGMLLCPHVQLCACAGCVHVFIWEPFLYLESLLHLALQLYRSVIGACHSYMV
jgi:hypothetical protein